MQLHVLSKSEAQRFDQPPTFNTVQHKKYFYLSDSLKRLLQPLRKPWTQVGFLLQWGYFRYSGRFFSVDKFKDEDIQFAIRQVEAAITTDTFRANYPSAVVYQHRSVILDKLGFHDFESKKYEFDYELQRLVAKRQRPKQIFYQLVQYLKANRIALPTSNLFVSTITHAFRHFEERLRDILQESLHPEDITVLNELLDEINIEGSVIYRLSQLKKINQKIQPSRIKASLENFSYLKQLFFQLLPVTERLYTAGGVVSQDLIYYHAQWTIKATAFQLQRMADSHMQYLHLLAFIQHQFFTYQDSLIEVLKSSVQSSLNQTEKEQKERYRASVALLPVGRRTERLGA